MKTFYLHLLAVLMGTLLNTHTAFAQPAAVRFEHLDSLQKAAPRLVVVLIYTNWCKHCATMEQTTFKNKEVLQLLKEQLYFVRLNAEEQSAINWRGRTFLFKPTGNNTGVHELAVHLAASNGELSYPTLTFLNPQLEILYQHHGFLSAADLKKLLLALQQEK